MFEVPALFFVGYRDWEVVNGMNEYFLSLDVREVVTSILSLTSISKGANEWVCRDNCNMCCSFNRTEFFAYYDLTQEKHLRIP